MGQLQLVPPEVAVAMFVEGLSTKLIADRFGVHQRTVQLLVQAGSQHGCPRLTMTHWT